MWAGMGGDEREHNKGDATSFPSGSREPLPQFCCLASSALLQRAPGPQQRRQGVVWPKWEAKTLSSGGECITPLINSAGGLELPPNSA